MKYSIWIIPPKQILNYYQSIVDDLAVKYNAPIFEPHLTVVGDIEMNLEKMIQVLQSMPKNGSIRISTEGLSYSTTYFQSVFVRVKSNAALMNLNIIIKKSLGLTNSVFMPHMSLLYGDFDMEFREKVTQSIEVKENSFDASELIITPAVSRPTEWKHVAKIGL